MSAETDLQRRLRHTRRLAQAAMMLAAFSLFVGVGLYAWFVGQRNDQRDIACRASEGAHLDEVQQLTRSYDLFADPPKGYEQLLKDPRVVQQLHMQERDARSDSDQFGVFVAPFCDQEGLGRAEPDPKLPDKPVGVP